MGILKKTGNGQESYSCHVKAVIYYKKDYASNLRNFITNTLQRIFKS